MVLRWVSWPESLVSRPGTFTRPMLSGSLSQHTKNPDSDPVSSLGPSGVFDLIWLDEQDLKFYNIQFNMTI